MEDESLPVMEALRDANVELSGTFESLETWEASVREEMLEVEAHREKGRQGKSASKDRQRLASSESTPRPTPSLSPYQGTPTENEITNSTPDEKPRQSSTNSKQSPLLESGILSPAAQANSAFVSLQALSAMNPTQALPLYCKELRLPTPQYDITASSSSSSLFSGTVFLPSTSCSPRRLGEVRHVYGMKRAKEECARQACVNLLAEAQKQHLGGLQGE